MPDKLILAYSGGRAGSRRLRLRRRRQRRWIGAQDELRRRRPATSASPPSRANALYHSDGQPEAARAEGATAVAHGCTGKGNDQVRLDRVRRRARP